MSNSARLFKGAGVNKIGDDTVKNVDFRRTDSTEKRHTKILEKRDRSFKRASKITNNTIGGDRIEKTTQETDELHGLTPLPQPRPNDNQQTSSCSEFLPDWLANPVRVAPLSRTKFKDLGIESYAVKSLQSKGFTEAFAVQSAAIKILNSENIQDAGDVVISAATGSGKTLSYLLPLIQDISRYSVTRLRGLIVLPTRELVSQVKEVAELCAAVFKNGDRKRVQIGTSVGNENIKTEQLHLIEHFQTYHPKNYEERLLQVECPWQDREDVGYGAESVFDFESLSTIPGFVNESRMKIDILICTPGRLVDHIKSTPGFSLKDIKWLVIDEADKLLDQSFQKWLPLVCSEIDPPQKDLLRIKRVRKIVLSATVTRNLSQLADLKLYRPTLISLESENNTSDQSYNESQKHVLPSSLLESAVKVEEEDTKPLYLLELLKRQTVIGQEFLSKDIPSYEHMPCLESKPVLSEPDSSDSEASSGPTSPIPSAPSLIKSNFPNEQKGQENKTLHGALIFTRSNEAAVRLGRLLALLYPPSSAFIGVLTSTLPRSTRQQYLKSFAIRKISILVASDLVSRGLDLPNLANVINYDLPTSLITYVHRVGRTARAGKVGNAWTLFTGSEAGWFWNEIGRSPAILRPRDKIERVNIKLDLNDEQRRAYQTALEKLKEEVTRNIS